MFLRRTRSGPREYLQLVESYRVAGGVRQRVLFSFGRIDQLDAAQIQTLVRGLERYTEAGASSVVAQPASAPPVIECASARSLGDTWVLSQLWKSLGLDAALRRALGARRAAHEPWVRAMVFHRLCDPGSKLGTLRWLETATVPGVATERAHHSALLRAMDALEDVADALEVQVLAALRPLLDQDVSVVFYDLTTVRAEGEGMVPGELRAVGHSKDRAIPSRQVVVGVVQSACGLPLWHTVHTGNISEKATLAAMLAAVKTKLPVQRVVVVADRGLMSHEQLEHMEADATGVDYIMAVPGRRYVEISERVCALGFTTDETALKETRDAQGRRLIVSRDAMRAQQTREKRDAAIARIEALAAVKVDKLNAQDAGERSRGRALSDGGVYHQIQSLIEESQLSRIIKTQMIDGLFAYTIDEAAKARAEALDGLLILITRIDAPMADVVARYKALADIETGFRVLKQDIEIAPMYHRLPERIRAHAAICFLALVLHRHLRARLRAGASKLSPTHALQTLRRIQDHRITVAGQMHRKTSVIDPGQRDLLTQLDLPLPHVDNLDPPATTSLNPLTESTRRRTRSHPAARQA